MLDFRRMAVPVGLAETNTFVAVLAQKRFTEAAKQQLGLSPPRVSEMVRALEKGLGVRLVERTTHSVAATAAGQRLLERLRPVPADYQAALESDVNKSVSGAPAGPSQSDVNDIVSFIYLRPGAC
jgi:DNA-binding transcriptional LysR family regulator